MDGQFLKPRIVRNDRLARTRVKAHERMSESVKSIDLSRAGPGEFRRTRSKFVEIIWMVCEAIFVSNPLQISHKLRAAVLRLFGAKIGRGVFLRDMKVKFPWNLEMGDHCWMGERTWIHNQDKVIIGDNVAFAHDVFITTGSHDIYKTMYVVTKPIKINDGVWITSRCIVTMGVEIGANTVVAAGSVVTKSLDPGCIYGGNPARFIRYRWSEEEREPS